jgi:hypothetical protein
MIPNNEAMIDATTKSSTNVKPLSLPRRSQQ